MTVTEDLSAMAPHVLYLVPPGYPVEVFRDRCPEGWEFDSLSEGFTAEEITAKLAPAHFVIQSSVVSLSLSDIDHAPSLRVVARQGVGLDKLDVHGFAQKGVSVTICPEGTTEPVAEHTLLLLLAAGRHLKQLSDDVRSGQKWPKTTYRRISKGLQGNTVTVVGYGRIGQAVVERLLPFGCEVAVVVREPRIPDLSHPNPRVRFTSDFDGALSSCAFLTLHTPLTSETRGMIGRRELALMRSDAFLVNTSRGELVDEEALLDALDAGVIAGAGLDVAQHEPPAADDPIRDHPLVLLTPHCAAGTKDALSLKADSIFTDLELVWAGSQPTHLVRI